MHESIWLQRQRFEEAEAYYYAKQAGTVSVGRKDDQVIGYSC